VKLLVRLRGCWNKTWFEPLAPYPLAALRIAFGVYLFAYFSKYFSIVDLSFSNSGVYSPYLIPDIAPAPWLARAIYYFTLLATAALCLGACTRTAAVLVFLLFEYHYYLNFAVNNTAYDRLNTIILFILCFVDSGAAWSFDERNTKATRLIPAWQIRLLQFQLAAVYFGSGLWKLFNSLWHGGQMLKFNLASPWASSVGFGILSLQLPDWLFTALTWGVIVFELCAGIGLYFRRTRPIIMAIGIVFHLCNSFILVIPEFLNCVTLYAVFLPFGKHKRQGADVVSRVR
jgi:uncharacterized membrane protein YphA (DoxX/SURF4 family)